ncbi:endo-1,4-beta-xylanase [Halolactibacillus miurensis]|uniref:Alpha/beta hydrolase fold n=1 Tax=Halolactibacillus miurensis TaxID=306541 RepID=A0A1I6R2K8_9BACI|nr:MULTISPECIES: alpha/beta hydrolase [Halolactibacillus]GEM03633.1 endo-1,4-beta-xylanase [Halolactibacillus miurensis]SFS58915.1 alpha/beta hydrolase fold [Halolactibacillus miurensis]
MQVITEYLREHTPKVTLTSYIIDDKEEFQTGMKRPAVVLVPGGGYFGVSDREGEPIALRLLGLGYHVFQLRYTTRDTKNETDQDMISDQALEDLATSFEYIHAHSDQFLVDTKKIILMGFSAGGHLSAMFATYGQTEAFLARRDHSKAVYQPACLVLGYPVVDYLEMMRVVDASASSDLQNFWQASHQYVFGTEHPTDDQLREKSPITYITAETVPTFLWHTVEDGLVPHENVLTFARVLAANCVPYELHLYQTGVHGLALSDETTMGEASHVNMAAQTWLPQLHTWLKQHGISIAHV